MGSIYALPVCCPWSEADIVKLEAVQMKFMAQVYGLSGHGYDARAQECGLQTVRDRLGQGRHDPSIQDHEWYRQV